MFGDNVASTLDAVHKNAYWFLNECIVSYSTYTVATRL